MSFRSRLTILALVLLTASSCGGGRRNPTTARASTLTDSVLGTLTYPAPSLAASRVTLSGGDWEGDSVGTGRERAHLVFNARGDLATGGLPAAVVVLFSDPGATGTFFDIIPVRAMNGAAHPGRATALGDRVRPESLWVSNQRAHLILLAHDSTDGLCCPSRRELRHYRLLGDSLALEGSELLARLPPGPGGT